MKSIFRHLMSTFLTAIILQVCMSEDEVNRNRETQDYCTYETFQPRCLKNEVIVMESAKYGRMRIGRCITSEEVEEQKLLTGDNPRILGCSADVLAILDKKCSGKTECDVRLSDIAAENIKPCFPGLVMYLEVSYECINVVDDKRSCLVSASKNPTHIIISSESQTNCGSKFQPWIVESPVGQKVSLSLLHFSTSRSTDDGEATQKCNSRGVILDKAARRNVSICAIGVQRTTNLYQSKGNKIEIFTNPSDWEKNSEENSDFMLKIEAVGCSDIIPPEDTWLKRNDDKIQIGCYSNRQTWQLNCLQGKWIGVLGNCSQGDGAEQVSVVKQQRGQTLSTNGEVLAIVAVCGFTLAICLAIMCIGAVCLRRLYGRMKKRDLHYKTLNHPVNTTTRSQATDRSFPIDVTTCNRFPGDEIRGFSMQPSTLQPINDGQTPYIVNSYGVEDDANHQLN